MRTERIPAPRGRDRRRQQRRHRRQPQGHRRLAEPGVDPGRDARAIATYGQRFTARSKLKKGHKGPKPPLPQPTGELLARYKRLGKVLDLSVRTINQRVVTGICRCPTPTCGSAPTSRPRSATTSRSAPTSSPASPSPSSTSAQYPYRSTAAQVLGTIGQIGKTELADSHFKGVAAGTDIGKDGLEYEYDKQPARRPTARCTSRSTRPASAAARAPSASPSRAESSS